MWYLTVRPILGALIFSNALLLSAVASATDYYVSTSTGLDPTVTCSNPETYALVDGDTLTLRVDRGTEQTVQFLSTDFIAMGAALASEVVAVLNSRATGITAYVASAGSTNYFRIRSNRPDITASIQVTGGSANTKFAFPTSEFSSEGTQAHPFGTISAAIRVAVATQSSPANIWVAAGTYYDNINMRSYVNLWGGCDPNTWTRDVKANETIINGALNEICVKFDRVTAGTIDGFKITSGRPTGYGYGGGIYAYYSSPTIRNNIISDNDKGGIFCNHSSATIENNTVITNTGSAIACSDSSCTIRGNIIKGNQLFGGDPRGASYGGGIFCDRSPVIIQYNAIIGSSAVQGGGGIFSTYSSATIQNNIICGNSADMDGGAGIYCYLGSLTIQNNILSGNSATGFGGGGIISYSSSPNIQGNIITGNLGGGIFCHENSSPTIQNNTITGNNNGGLGCGDGSSPLVENNVFYENNEHDVAERDGTSDPRVYYNEFYGSTPGMYRDEGNTSLTTIAQVNALAEAEFNISVTPGFLPLLTGVSTGISYDSTSLQSTLTDASGTFIPDSLVGLLLNPDITQYRQYPIASNTATTITVWGNITGVATAGDSYEVFDYHLGSGSALADVGIDTGVDVDIDGEWRPRGAGFDIGADEFLDETTDTDNDGTPDMVDPDDDNDGMSDEFEETHLFNPVNAADAALDADSDGLSNVDEFNHQTNPHNSDTDADGMRDGWEVQHGLNPLDNSDVALDPDADGLSNLSEYQRSSNPNDSDSDDDGLPDGFEVQNSLNPINAADAAYDSDNDGLSNLDEYNRQTNLRSADTDGDGMRDGWEVQHGLDPLNSGDAGLDADQDGLTNLSEYQHGSNPNDSDTDDDNMPDRFEVENLLNPANPADANLDADGDGLSNLNEYNRQTGVRDADSDDDGMQDGWEVEHSLNPLDGQDAGQDSDADGLTNLEEFGRHTNPQDGDSPAHDFYVDANAAPGGTGTPDSPFASVPEAMAAVQPTVSYLVTFNLASGVYQAAGIYAGPLTLHPGTTLVGADQNATIINAGDVEVTVSAAEHTALENLTIATDPSATGTVNLLKIDDVSCAVRNVVFDGLNTAFSIGVGISGPGSSASVISDCTFKRLSYGVRAVNTGAVITQCLFDDIEITAIFIRPPTPKQRQAWGLPLVRVPLGADAPQEEVPLLGDVSAAETTGHNDFSRMANIATFINSTSTQTIRAQLNDWGLPSSEEIRSRIRSAGDVIVEPFLYQGQVVGGEGEGEDEIEELPIGEESAPEAEPEELLPESEPEGEPTIEREPIIEPGPGIDLEPEPEEVEIEEPSPTPTPLPEPDEEPSEGEGNTEDPAPPEDTIEEEPRPDPEPEPEEREPGEQQEQSLSPQPTVPVINFCPTARVSASTALAAHLDWIRDWRDELLVSRLGKWAIANYYR